MISNPSVLILDEPTSGLDSFTATIILSMLAKIAKEGKTVIFTIHQPSSRLFGMLDRLILLHRGDTIYQGGAQDIVPYMAKIGIEVPAKYNVADFFMLEISDYKLKIFQKNTGLNEDEYRRVTINII
jgi:ATP-binding cassette subfamily G (WHITE) protein 1